MKAALIQMTSSDNPDENAREICARISEAAHDGADLVLTPEVSNCVSMNRAHQAEVLRHQDDDPTLKAVRNAAKTNDVWVSLGSIALKGGEGGRFVNRSFVISPNGAIKASYDKIHMFDVSVSETETYEESSGYAPGSEAVACPTDVGTLGLTICYDLRFPYLHRDLAKAGAEIILVPSAFSPVTGAAHWEPLLRSRAIETGCFVLAAAQTGQHSAKVGASRQTYGHSLAVSPWGEVLADGGTSPGITYVDLDLPDVSKARSRIPALTHDRPYDGP